MKKIKIAQIGIGHDHAEFTLASLLELSDIFDFAGIAIPEKEKTNFSYREHCYKNVKELSVEEILNDAEITAVCVETEEVNLTYYAQQAIDHGKHVHMDKPGGLDRKAFRRMIGTARKKALTVQIAYMYRYNPCIIEALDRVNKGELGEIISVEAQMSRIDPIEKRQWLKTFKGGMMFYLGCHLIDLVLLFQGIPERIISMNKCTGFEGVTAEDYGFAALEYKNGISFVKTSALEYGGFARRQLVITGTKGSIEIKPLEMFCGNKVSVLYTDSTEYFSEQWGDMGIGKRTEAYDRYNKMMVDFYEICLGKKENLYTYEWELTVYDAVLEACGYDMEKLID